MKCSICGKAIRIETSFENLFQFRMECDECRRIEQQVPVIESIPFHRGLLHWMTICPELPATLTTEKQHARLYHRGFEFFLEKNPQTSLFIIIDFAEIEHFPDWSMILFLEENVFVASLLSHSFHRI